MSKAALEIHEGKTKLRIAEEVPATIMLFFFLFLFFIQYWGYGYKSCCLNNFIASPWLPRVIAMPL